MTALLCCYACLHDIVEPERPVLEEGRFFHAGHTPPKALVHP